MNQPTPSFYDQSARSRTIQQPARAVLYGIGVWFTWVTVVVTAYELLPAEIGSSAVFVATTWALLSALVAGVAASYLRRVGASSVGEGLVIGLVWAAMFVVLDLGHYAAMHPALLDGYLERTVPPYLIVPALTTVLMGGLRRR